VGRDNHRLFLALLTAFPVLTALWEIEYCLFVVHHPDAPRTLWPPGPWVVHLLITIPVPSVFAIYLLGVAFFVTSGWPCLLTHRHDPSPTCLTPRSWILRADA
jgi:hypothetical protein